MILIKVLVPSGVLGLGFDLEALKHGIKNNPNIISIDGGSTDSGPYSLGSGTSKYSRAAIKAEWKNLMIARKKANAPVSYTNISRQTNKIPRKGREAR